MERVEALCIDEISRAEEDKGQGRRQFCYFRSGLREKGRYMKTARAVRNRRMASKKDEEPGSQGRRWSILCFT